MTLEKLKRLFVAYYALGIFFQVSMEVGDGGKTYFITGLWDPGVRDLLVLNTETPKGTVMDVFKKVLCS